jgi:hypothetical protein
MMHAEGVVAQVSGQDDHAGHVAEAVNSPHRDLIEQARKINKMLSLYVLAFQDDTALTPDVHAGLVRALRSFTGAIEQKAGKGASAFSADSQIEDQDVGSSLHGDCSTNDT